jgi:prolyl oligopeptidase
MSRPRSPAAVLAYPPTRTVDVVETLHGRPVADPYRWLEDGASPEVRAWVTEQDAAARRHLDALGGRQALAERLRQLFYFDSLSPPHRAGNRLFYYRHHAEREKAVLYWREGDGGEERVLIDPNALSPDGTTSLGAWMPSHDGMTLAYALHANNADEAILEVMDVASGTVSGVDRIEGARYASPSWTPAGDGFYYVWLPTDPSIPEDRRLGDAEIRFHALGTDRRCDPVVRERTGDPEVFPGVRLSQDGHWLFASESIFSRDDLFYRDLRTEGSPWTTLVAGVEANFSVLAWEDRFFVMTSDGAPRGRVFAVDPASPERDAWREIVPETPGAVLRSASIVGGRLVLTYLWDSAGAIELRTLEGELVRRIDLPSIGSTSGVVGAPDQDEAYFEFSSFLHPPEVHRLSAKSGTTELWSKVARAVDPAPFTLERVRYRSKDGTLIPMYLVHPAGIARDGSTPFLLIGYGGFSVSMEPIFDASIYPWLEAGGGFALASLRGGGEYGEDWHRAGALDNKQNVFDDFIAAAEHLVDEGYTAPGRLAIQGGSNGGLLVGAALTQRPDLFAAAICSVPLLDMVRYHLFGSGRAWVSEYGSPEEAEDFHRLYGYSPYHRVRAGVEYPAVLFMSSDADDRVDPLHARKMAAALQATGEGRRPVLLRIEAHAGHTGAGRLQSAVETWTDCYAFLFDVLGVAPPRSLGDMHVGSR